MSAYDNDPRVQRNRTSDESYDVETTAGDWWIVLREGDGTWSANQYGGAKANSTGFSDADQAIHSLIGDPR